MNNKRKAVILARVSSKAQEDEGYSLDSQVKLLSGYCTTKGFIVERVFKIAETASKEQSRKVFKELMQYLTKNGIYHLAVEKTDRLTRNMRDAVAIDDWLSVDADRMLHLVKENLQLHKESKSDVKFMWSIHLAVAKKYTDNLREEAMKGWAEKLAQGWLPARPPIGYMTITEHGKRIHVPNPATMNSICAMFELYLQPGQSIESIARKMSEIGLVTSQGRPIVVSHLHKILSNPFYIGINRFNGQEYPGAQTPIIRQEVWEAVQQKLHGKRPTLLQKHNVALSGIAHCATCGNQITWQHQKGRYYGACQRRDERCKNRKYKYVREDTVQELVAKELGRMFCPSQTIMEWVLNTMRENVNQTIDNRQEVETNTRSRIQRLKSMDEVLYDDKLSGAITLDRYERKHDQIVKEVETLELAILSLDNSIAERKKRGLYLVELTQKAAKYYMEKNADEKRQILIELLEDIVVNNEVVSIILKDQARRVAESSDKTRQIMAQLKINDRTFADSENNSGQSKEKSAETALYSIWQGHVESNHDRWFWRPVY